MIIELNFRTTDVVENGVFWASHKVQPDSEAPDEEWDDFFAKKEQATEELNKLIQFGEFVTLCYDTATKELTIKKPEE